MATKKNSKSDVIIDQEADFRAGGYHNTYSHEFEISQRNNKKPLKEKSDKELNENLKNQQNEKSTQSSVKLRDKNNQSLPTNKNYGWKDGFDRSETYGSELKKNPEVDSFQAKDKDA